MMRTKHTLVIAMSYAVVVLKNMRGMEMKSNVIVFLKNMIVSLREICPTLSLEEDMMVATASKDRWSTIILVGHPSQLFEEIFLLDHPSHEEIIVYSSAQCYV